MRRNDTRIQSAQRIDVGNAFDIRAGQQMEHDNEQLKHVACATPKEWTKDYNWFLHFSFRLFTEPPERRSKQSDAHDIVWTRSLGFLFQFQVIGHAIAIVLSVNVIHLAWHCP